MNSNEYDVFLSFRGTDTRQGFTDVLYNYMNMADIRTFRDDNELAVGDEIGTAIFGAIAASKICIPIFSPNYANSKWCLREVTKMVELEKTIVPVFYEVSPDVVKLKGTSPYVGMMEEMSLVNQEEMKQWKNALTVAASHKGLELRDTLYTPFCKEIIDRVLLILGPRKRPSIDHFVGEDNKTAAMKLLDMESSDEEVIYLVIHGMGGIGKTTITEFIYNELVSSFQHSSFVPNVRELFKSNAGVEDLRSYLYRNLQPKIVEPSEHFINGLTKTKVLIVLDDVDNYEQIQKVVKDPTRFGSGSRIIVTTRDKNIVKAEEGRSQIIRYLEMKELKDDRGLELFSRCAFGTLLPPSKYANLSKGFVAYAGGLPLAITVIAKYLRNTTEGVWEEVLERAKRNPLKEVKEKLLLSYDSLDEDEKTIFLDIACFFVDSIYTETSNMFYMWEACGLFPRLSLEVLQSRSLVRLGQKNELLMHDQLRDLGRNIAGSRSDPTKQTRLWESPKEALDVLKKKENIEAVRVPTYGEDLRLDIFSSNLYKLRFLEMWPNLEGEFRSDLPQLRWLSSRHIFKTGKLLLTNLLILELSGSDVDENWAGWDKIQVLGKLKVLDLSSCHRLERTPRLAKTMVLERLDLSNCSRLASIDPSIGDLHQLNYLSLQNCTSLRRLPAEMGNLQNLTKLDLEGTGITTLPDSITNLTSLKYLNLRSAVSLSDLPETLGNLHSLVDLNVSHTEITGLPDSIGGLKHLERLHLRKCRNLKTLPDSLGELKLLQRLDIGNSGITTLPESTRDLEKLKYLKLSGSKIDKLPCTTSNRLLLLQTLKLERCDGLQELLDFSASNLKELKIRSSVLNTIHNLSNLQHLISLELVSDSSTFDWNGSFPHNLQSLSLKSLAATGLPDLSGLRKLVTLKIQSCEKLVNLSGLGKLQCLSYLCIKDCPSLKMLEELVELQGLSELMLIKCEELTEIPGLGKLGGLTKVRFEGCSSLERLEELVDLQMLSELMLIQCKKLVEIPGLGKLQGLTKLRFEGCDSLEELDDLSLLVKLKKLSIVGCERLKGIIRIGEVQSLISLHIQKCPAKLESLEKLANLTSLNLINCEEIRELSGLSKLKHLATLRAIGCKSLEKMDDLGKLTVLKHLSLIGCGKLTGVPGIRNLTGLVYLYVKGCGSLSSFENISKLTNLRALHVIGCPKLTDIPGRHELPHLTNVKLPIQETFPRLD